MTPKQGMQRSAKTSACSRDLNFTATMAALNKFWGYGKNCKIIVKKLVVQLAIDDMIYAHGGKFLEKLILITGTIRKIFGRLVKTG